MVGAGKAPAAQSPPSPAAVPAAGTLTVKRQASAAANVATNFEGTACAGPGIYLRDGDTIKILEPTTISQQQSGSGVLSGLTYGLKSVKSRAAIRGARANVRIENAQPEFLFCFEESQAGLSYTTKGAVNPSEFPLVSLTVNRKKRQRSFVVGKINQWSGSRAGATPQELRDLKFDRIKPGVYDAEPVEDLRPGEYAFYFSGETRADSQEPMAEAARAESCSRSASIDCGVDSNGARASARTRPSFHAPTLLTQRPTPLFLSPCSLFVLFDFVSFLACLMV